VEVDFKGLDVTTSVNFVNLIHAEGLKVKRKKCNENDFIS
jgi:hypothetical protein